MSGRTEPRQQPGYACEECRRKKLRCDRQRPRCGYCTNSGILCKVHEQRIPRGSKKRNSHSIHSRLVADGDNLSPPQSTPGVADAALGSSEGITTDSECDTIRLDDERTPLSIRATSQQASGKTYQPSITCPNFPLSPESLEPSNQRQATQEDIALSEFVRADLTQLYFDRVHPILPILWPSKIYTWMSEGPQTDEYRQCLQYAMWTSAGAFSTQFEGIRDALYTKARSILDGLDLKDGDMIACRIEHIQAWILITFYEFAKTPYRRAWLSAGRVFRLVQLLRLYDVDNPKNNTDPELDGIEKEEKRRVFWIAYCLDRLVSVSNATPVTLSEEVVGTRLPCPEADFQSGLISRAPFLSEAMSSVDLPCHSSLAECVIIVTIGSRALTHKQVSDVESMYGSAPHDFTVRHEWLVSMVTSRLESLERNYPCLSAASDPMVMFVYIVAQTAVVYLCCIMEPFIGNEQYRDLPWDFLKKGPLAAQRIACLAKQHMQVGYFKMHTFMPLPIYLSVVKLMLHREQRREPEYTSEEVKAIEVSLQASLDALRKLQSVNNLATYYLGLLDGRKDLTGLTIGDGWCLGTG